MLNTISGKDFCEQIEVNYADVLDKITQFQSKNLQFIKEYKEKDIASLPTCNEVKSNLENFYD